ncbi:MAG: hypothetical protein ACJLS3_01225 [Erythrobacter sp.]
MMKFAASAMLAGLMIASPAHPAPPVTSTNAPASGPTVPPEVEARVLRAKANLLALRQGTVPVSSLSAQDMQDVLDLERLARGEGADNRTFAQQCVDREVRRAGGRPSQLAREIIKLKCR